MSTVEEIRKVLEAERISLLSGDFDTLEKLIARKAILVDKMTSQNPDVSKHLLEELSLKARHNESLLVSARRGLQSAMAQLKQLSDGESQKTYSREGRRKSLTITPTSMTQKC